MQPILIACGDVDLLKKIVGDLPDGAFKPIATKKGKGIPKKLEGRNVDLAIIHETLADCHGAQLAQALKDSSAPPRVLLLVSGDLPGGGPFEQALKYPVPGPVLRAAIRRLDTTAQSGPDLEQWRAFYNELKARKEQWEAFSYYQIMGVKPSAPHHLIVSIFDSLSLRYHPDRYQQYRSERWGQAVYEHCNDLYKLLTEAYGILSDRKLRAKYDDALAGGELRLSPDDASGKDAGPQHLSDISDQATTKKFLKLAQQDLARRDVAKALQNLRFAQSMEPDNEAIRAKIAELEGKNS